MPSSLTGAFTTQMLFAFSAIKILAVMAGCPLSFSARKLLSKEKLSTLL
jgi:hypothetical protein